MARSKVPKFGGWEGEDDVGYTVRFDTVRNRKPGGPIINPNDPQANQFTSPPPATAAAPPQQTKPTPPQQTKPKPKKPEFGAWDEQEVPYTQYFDDKAKVNAGGQSEPQINYNVAPTQPPKTNPKKPEFGAWDEQEVPYTEYFDSRAKVNVGGQSEPQMNYNVAPTQPLKPNPVVKSNETIPRPNGGRGVNSADPRAKPPGVKFVESESNSRQSPLHHGAAGRGRGTTPAGPRQRTHPTAGPSPGRGGASVPKFGDWNNGQADGYTVVFNNLQKERKGGEPLNNNPTHPNQSSGRSPPPKQGGCLSWILG